MSDGRAPREITGKMTDILFYSRRDMMMMTHEFVCKSLVFYSLQIPDISYGASGDNGEITAE